MQLHKIIGFAPALLQLVMSDQVDVPVRQAGMYVQRIFNPSRNYVLSFMWVLSGLESKSSLIIRGINLCSFLTMRFLLRHEQLWNDSTLLLNIN